MSNDYHTLPMLRLCAIDPPKYGWTACGGVSSILEPHEMARRPEAKERFLKQRRDADAAKVGAAASAGDAATATTKTPDKLVLPESPLYAITEFSEPLDGSAGAASAPAARSEAESEERDKKEGVKTARHGTIRIRSVDEDGNLDIWTYHRGRVGQEPRNSETGDLLCDTAPFDTNHGWLPPNTVAKVTVKFPLVDPDEEEYVDSDLDEEYNDNDDGVIKKLEGSLHTPRRPDPEEEGVGSSGRARASRSRASRGCGGPQTSDGSAGKDGRQRKHEQTASIPHFSEVVSWDMGNPDTPSPEEYAAGIAAEFGLSFPQVMDLKESIERQLDEHVQSQPRFRAPVALRDPYGAERPSSQIGPPESRCGLALGDAATNKAAGAPGRHTVPSRGGGGGGTGSGRPAPRSRPPGAVKPDRGKVQAIPKDQIQVPDRDEPSQEVIRRAMATSRAAVAECVRRGEATLTHVKNEVCHICHNRKEKGLLFHCRRHAYCNYHCATRLGFYVDDYNKKDPTNIPVDYCPICVLDCTCAKCVRRLAVVAGKMKAECRIQGCGFEEVVMDNLYELCSSKVKGEGNKVRPSSSGSGKKKVPKKAKIGDDARAPETPKAGTAGGNKRIRSKEPKSSHVSLPTTSRSMRSSPSYLGDLYGDARPRKKKKGNALASLPVLKVPPSEFPREMFGAKDLDPSSPQELNNIYTPGGIFPAKEGEDADPVKTKPKYQNRRYAPGETHFFLCAVCGKDEGAEQNFVCCKNCPRVYHEKCLHMDSSSGEEKRECKRCERDQSVGEEEKVKGMVVNKRIQKAYAKYEPKTYPILTLGTLVQSLEKLKKYDYGSVFASPVNTEEVMDYFSVISRPMDYGSIIEKLENGDYEPFPDGHARYGDMDKIDGITLRVLMDITIVHHNCFLYNKKGSSFYRAGKVQRSKWKAYYDGEIKDHVSESVQDGLAEFERSCEEERDATAQSRAFQVSNPEGARRKALAVFDPDTKRIVKQYSSKSSAKTAALMLYDAGYNCEWELSQGNVKARIEAAEDPSSPLFGYQWLLAEKLKSGNFLTNPYFRNDDLASPTPNNIVVLKEDTLSGVKLRGFESEQSAYEDWLSAKSGSFDAHLENNADMIDFAKGYLDGGGSINGIAWRRVQPNDSISTTPSLVGKVVMEEEHVDQAVGKVVMEDVK